MSKTTLNQDRDASAQTKSTEKEVTNNVQTKDHSGSKTDFEPSRHLKKEQKHSNSKKMTAKRVKNKKNNYAVFILLQHQQNSPLLVFQIQKNLAHGLKSSIWKKRMILIMRYLVLFQYLLCDTI
jgi:hypothetical protein